MTSAASNVYARPPAADFESLDSISSSAVTLSLGKERMRKACRDIQRLAFLSDNWDTYGGCRPSQSAIAAAVRFMGWIGDVDVPPQVAALSSDGVHLEWESPNGTMTIEFNRDGLVSLLVEDESGNTRAEAIRQSLEKVLSEHSVSIGGFTPVAR